MAINLEDVSRYVADIDTNLAQLRSQPDISTKDRQSLDELLGLVFSSSSSSGLSGQDMDIKGDALRRRFLYDAEQLRRTTYEQIEQWDSHSRRLKDLSMTIKARLDHLSAREDSTRPTLGGYQSDSQHSGLSALETRLKATEEALSAAEEEEKAFTLLVSAEKEGNNAKEALSRGDSKLWEATCAVNAMAHSLHSLPATWSSSPPTLPLYHDCESVASLIKQSVSRLSLSILDITKATDGKSIFIPSSSLSSSSVSSTTNHTASAPTSTFTPLLSMTSTLPHLSSLEPAWSTPFRSKPAVSLSHSPTLPLSASKSTSLCPPSTSPTTLKQSLTSLINSIQQLAGVVTQTPKSSDHVSLPIPSTRQSTNSTTLTTTNLQRFTVTIPAKPTSSSSQQPLSITSASSPTTPWELLSVALTSALALQAPSTTTPISSSSDLQRSSSLPDFNSAPFLSSAYTYALSHMANHLISFFSAILLLHTAPLPSPSPATPASSTSPMPPPPSTVTKDNTTRYLALSLTPYATPPSPSSSPSSTHSSPTSPSTSSPQDHLPSTTKDYHTFTLTPTIFTCPYATLSTNMSTVLHLLHAVATNIPEVALPNSPTSSSPLPSSAPITITSPSASSSPSSSSPPSLAYLPSPPSLRECLLRVYVYLYALFHHVIAPSIVPSAFTQLVTCSCNPAHTISDPRPSPSSSSPPFTALNPCLGTAITSILGFESSLVKAICGYQQPPPLSSTTLTTSSLTRLSSVSTNQPPPPNFLITLTVLPQNMGDALYISHVGGQLGNLTLDSSLCINNKADTHLSYYFSRLSELVSSQIESTLLSHIRTAITTSTFDVVGAPQLRSMIDRAKSSKNSPSLSQAPNQIIASNSSSSSSSSSPFSSNNSHLQLLLTPYVHDIPPNRLGIPNLINIRSLDLSFTALSQSGDSVSESLIDIISLLHDHYCDILAAINNATTQLRQHSTTSSASTTTSFISLPSITPQSLEPLGSLILSRAVALFLAVAPAYHAKDIEAVPMLALLIASDANLLALHADTLADCLSTLRLAITSSSHTDTSSSPPSSPSSPSPSTSPPKPTSPPASSSSPFAHSFTLSELAQSLRGLSARYTRHALVTQRMALVDTLSSFPGFAAIEAPARFASAKQTIRAAVAQITSFARALRRSLSQERISLICERLCAFVCEKLVTEALTRVDISIDAAERIGALANLVLDADYSLQGSFTSTTSSSSTSSSSSSTSSPARTAWTHLDIARLRSLASLVHADQSLTGITAAVKEGQLLGMATSQFCVLTSILL